jgi:hypothetical protein
MRHCFLFQILADFDRKTAPLLCRNNQDFARTPCGSANNAMPWYV